MRSLFRFGHAVAAAIVVLFVMPLPALAQLQGFALTGPFAAGSDEGTIGSGAGFGGGVTIPLSARALIELDGYTATIMKRRSGDAFYETRRSLLMVSLLYRWPKERWYLFAGVGSGVQLVEFVWREDNFADWYTPTAPWVEIRPRVYEWHGEGRRRINFAPRVGVVVFPKSWLGLRLDGLVASWHRAIRFGVTIAR